jgi:hypothetical protein
MRMLIAVPLALADIAARSQFQLLVTRKTLLSFCR